MDNSYTQDPRIYELELKYIQLFRLQKRGPALEIISAEKELFKFRRDNRYDEDEDAIAKANAQAKLNIN